MDRQKYVDTYSKQRPYRLYAEHPDVQSFFDSTAQWSGKFSTAILDRLKTGPMQHEDAADLTSSYTQWMQSYLASFTSKFGKIAEELDEKTLEEIAGQMSFHLTSFYSADLWRNFLTGKRSNKEHIRRTQIDIAATCIDFMSPLAEKFKHGELYNIDKEGRYRLIAPADSVSIGIANQLDTYVSLLDAANNERDSVFHIIPAPALFENSAINSQLNTDFIIFNQTNNSAHGAQAKTNKKINVLHKIEQSEGEYQGYDDDYVTVIDGMHDLKNFTAMRVEGTTTPVYIPMPGIYSAHFLVNQKQAFRNRVPKGKGMINPVYGTHIAQKKLQARKIIELSPSVNDLVQTHLGSIALHAAVINKT